MVDGKEASRSGQTVLDRLTEVDRRLIEEYPKPGHAVGSGVFKNDKALKRMTAYGEVYVLVSTSSSDTNGARSESVTFWFVDPRYEDGDLFWEPGRLTASDLGDLASSSSRDSLTPILEHLTALADGEFQPLTNFHEFPRAND